MAGLKDRLVRASISGNPSVHSTTGNPLGISRQIQPPSQKSLSHLRSFYTNETLCLNHKQTLINFIVSDVAPAKLSTPLVDSSVRDKAGTPIRMAPNLSDATKNILENLLSKHTDVFASSKIDLQKARIPPAVIKSTVSDSVHSPSLQMSSVERSHLNEVFSSS